MKVGKPPPPPPQSSTTHHVRPHKAGGPKGAGGVTGGFKTMKSKTARAAADIDPSQVGEELSADELDKMQKLQPKGEAGQQGFSQQGKQDAQLGKPAIQDAPKEGVTLTEPHLHAMLASICNQLDELAQEIDLSLGQPKPAGQAGGAPELKRVKTEEQLRDILRQVMSGDFGFHLGTDPNTTLGKLFWRLKGWPRGVPPNRKPTQQAPWSADEWDEFVAWLNAPPPLPPAEELL